MLGRLRRVRNKFALMICPGVVGIATAGLIFQWVHFLPAIETDSTRIMLQTTSVALYAMCFISYYFAITIKSSLPATLVVPRIKSQLRNNHPLYTEKKTCEKDKQRYKPPRTSHCHQCGCVTRMDHHCPFTDNCVGARNLKAFILFCLYGGVFAIQFLVLSVVFYFKLSSGKVQPLSEFVLAAWMFLSFASFLLSFSMNSLAISNLVMAGKNVTQLQLLKGVFSLKKQNNRHPNPYDLGFLTNINTVFGGDYWLFWCPTPVKSDNDFTDYPMRPPVTQAQIKQLPEDIQKQIEDPLIGSIPKTIDQLRKQEEGKYEGVVFFYLGKAYQLMKEEIKETLAEINKLDQSEEVHGGRASEQALHTEEDQQILADIYES